MSEPYISSTRAREVIASMKGGTRIGYATLRRLIRNHGLPTHPDPSGSAHPAFLESEIRAWQAERKAPPHGTASQRRTPGRPPER